MVLLPSVFFVVVLFVFEVRLDIPMNQIYSDILKISKEQQEGLSNMGLHWW